MSGADVLLSVDLEPAGNRWDREALAAFERATDLTLEFLAERDLRATFFVVARAAREAPALVQRVAAAGHEIGLHTWSHTRLDRLTPRALRADLDRSREALAALGIDRVFGFRAPFFSLTRETAWALDVLAEAGLSYDASTVPVYNPVAGFPGHPPHVHRLANGLWSVPLSTLRLAGPIGIPFSGGVYLRLLPGWLRRLGARSCRRRGEPIGVYVHPYDWDPATEVGEVFAHNPLFNRLLELGRDQTPAHLAALLEGNRDWRIIDYLEHRSGGALRDGPAVTPREA